MGPAAPLYPGMTGSNTRSNSFKRERVLSFSSCRQNLRKLALNDIQECEVVGVRGLVSWALEFVEGNCS
jgi:hypothetical protein